MASGYIRLCVHRGLSGQVLFEREFALSVLVKDLRGEVWNTMSLPTHRLKSKSRQILVGVIVLVSEGVTLQDHLSLELCQLRNGSIVHAVTTTAPNEVKHCSNEEELFLQLQHLLQCFTEERSLGALGSQRFLYRDRGRYGRNWPSLKVIQIQTQQALPGFTGRNRPAVMEDLAEALELHDIAPECRQIGRCMFWGERLPPETTVLSVYTENEEKYSHSANLFALMRSPAGITSLQFGGFLMEFASGSLTQHLRLDDVKEIVAKAASKVKKYADELNSPFDLTFSALMGLTYGKYRHASQDCSMTELCKLRKQGNVPAKLFGRRVWVHILDRAFRDPDVEEQCKALDEESKSKGNRRTATHTSIPRTSPKNKKVVRTMKVMRVNSKAKTEAVNKSTLKK